MIKKTLPLFIIILLIEFNGCTNDSNKILPKRIMVIVENHLVDTLNESIQVYKNDLENEGYEVIINTEIDLTTKPEDIRKILQAEHKKNPNLSGAVFVGNISAPLFNKLSDQGDAYWHDYLADFYYMDLDGTWIDSDNNGVFDEHLDTDIEIWNKIRRKLNIKDNREPEIWVSRIRSDKLTSLGNEVDLLKKYFTKNHKYRTDKLKLPPKRAFIISAGVNLEKSDWGAYPKIIYSDVKSILYQDQLADSLRMVLHSDLGYEWGAINVFSGPRIHHFSHFDNEINPEWWKSANGRKLIAEYSETINNSNDVGSKEINSIQPKVLFYHLLTSEVGRHDYPDNLGSTYIFSGMGLAAIAGTQHSGSVGSKLLYEELANGKSIGESWKDALVWLVDHSEDKISIFYYPDSEEILAAGKSNYKAVLLGDGTLKLPIRK